jgi:hypothetical protein
MTSLGAGATAASLAREHSGRELRFARYAAPSPYRPVRVGRVQALGSRRDELSQVRPDRRRQLAWMIVIRRVRARGGLDVYSQPFAEPLGHLRVDGQPVRADKQPHPQRRGPPSRPGQIPLTPPSCGVARRRTLRVARAGPLRGPRRQGRASTDVPPRHCRHPGLPRACRSDRTGQGARVRHRRTLRQ